VTSVSLTLQPVCSVIFAALILSEAPTALQLAGAAGILCGLVISTLGRRSAPAPEPELAG
jgi:drug/metabolite transporter (DMT)-like permease